MKLTGKKIIITGGTMGIGQAVAGACVKEGAEVIVVSRHGPYRLNVSNHPAVKKFASLMSKKGVIDGLVNCAGVYGPIGKTGDVDLAELEKTLRINLLGTIYMCHYFLPLLKKNKGKIVNLAGGGAAGAFPHYSSYAVSKVGIVRFTENLALEYKGVVDVNAIAPGFVNTRLHQETVKAGAKAGLDFLNKTKSEIERGGTNPELAAQLAVFLLSKQSDGITGKFISAPWDDWRSDSFQKKLKSDADFCTLRRIDDKFFGKL